MFKGKTRDRPEIQESRFKTYAARLKKARKLSLIFKILTLVAAVFMLGLTFFPVKDFLLFGFLPAIPVIALVIFAYGFQVYAAAFTDAEKHILYDMEQLRQPVSKDGLPRKKEDERIPLR